MFIRHPIAEAVCAASDRLARTRALGWRRRAAGLARRLLGIVLALAVLASSTGVRWVVVNPPPGQQSAEWFPCKGHRCGCLTAAMCRSHCCCERAQPAAPIDSPGCCHGTPSGRASEPAPASAAEPSLRLVIKCRECSGEGAFEFASAPAWQAPAPGAGVPSSAGHEPAAIVDLDVPNSLPVCPDLPPPRA